MAVGLDFPDPSCLQDILLIGRLREAVQTYRDVDIIIGTGKLVSVVSLTSRGLSHTCNICHISDTTFKKKLYQR